MINVQTNIFYFFVNSSAADRYRYENGMLLNGGFDCACLAGRAQPDI